MRTYKGRFKPKNPQKYEGDPTTVTYRSSWELKVMLWLDSHPEVISWSSEEIVIPYLSPVDNKFHRYFVDFKVKTEKGTKLIEVKPASQTRPPNPVGKKKKTFLLEARTWAINQAKWKAAENFCDLRGWEFIKLTEKEIGIIK
jgi:hypothetical protein